MVLDERSRHVISYLASISSTSVHLCVHVSILHVHVSPSMPATHILVIAFTSARDASGAARRVLSARERQMKLWMN